ncbi:MAG: hypothetical protein HY861_03110 [Chlamydiia bacterium]|nr:hypothetical protein [Chlamydiia bacterium]
MTIPNPAPDRIDPSKPLEQSGAVRPASPGTDFQSYMQRGKAPEGAPNSEASGMMPAAIAPAGAPQGPPTMNTLLVQAKTAQDSLGTIQDQLQTPNLKFKRSQTRLLRNKLTNAQDYSRSAAARLGVETPQEKTGAQLGTIGRFLAYINDGQDQFAAIQKKLQEMSATGKQLDPGEMMLLQSRMNLAQQEIEYSSTLLSKVTSSITTIMGIQL